MQDNEPKIIGKTMGWTIARTEKLKKSIRRSIIGNQELSKAEKSDTFFFIEVGNSLLNNKLKVLKKKLQKCAL